MSESIQISVPGEELENVVISLTKEEIRTLYLNTKDNRNQVVELEKKISSLENSKKYSEERRERAEIEIAQANTLLTALGVQEKTDSEVSYSQQQLPISTRIALYIAKKVA
jgi:hypothetical protein